MFQTQNLPTKRRIKTQDVLEFFTEKGSEFTRLKVEDVIFSYDVDKSCKWVARLNQAKIELKKRDFC